MSPESRGSEREANLVASGQEAHPNRILVIHFHVDDKRVTSEHVSRAHSQFVRHHGCQHDVRGSCLNVLSRVKKLPSPTGTRIEGKRVGMKMRC